MSVARVEEEVATVMSGSNREDTITRRQQVASLDRGLLESVEHEFFNFSPDGVLFIGRDGCVLAANRAQARMHGYESPDDLIGFHATLLLVPSDRDRARRNIECRLSGEDVGSTDYEGLRKDGTTFYVEISTAILRDPGGEVFGYMCITRDRTEQRLAEMSLRESEERYRVLFDGAIEGIYQTSMDGKDLKVNEAWAQMLGYGSAVEGIAGDTAEQVWADPGEQARFVSLLREHGVVRGYECQFVRKDGTRIWVSINGRVVLSPDGELAGYEGFVEDITERKRAQEVLREKDSQFRNYVEDAPVAIIVTRDGVCLYANQALADILGVESAGTLVGGPIYQGFAPHLQEESKERSRRRSLGLEAPPEFESVLQRSDGSQFPVHAAIGAIQLQDGSANIAFITDITERRRAEQALSQSEAMRDVAERVARVGSWRWDFDPTAFFWSEELFELFDVDPDTFDGDVLAALESRIHADDVGTFWRARAAALATGNAPPIEFRVVHRDGSVHFIHGESTAERDETGRAVAIVGYFQDVTDRHESAARLEAAAFEWRATFDAMSDSVSLFDRDGRIVRCNAATVALTGRDFRDVVGHYCHEVFHSPDYVHCPRRRAFATGQAETEIIERDGSWLRATFTPEKDAAGQVVGGVHVVTDITQLRQAEQAASERSHFLEELLEAIPAPVHNTDLTWHYVACNEAYAQTLGLSKQEVIGKTVYDIHPPEAARLYDASDKELLAHPEQPVEILFETSHPDGHPRYLMTHKAVYSDVTGKPAGIVGVSFDVTEIRQTQRELAESAVKLRLTLEGAVAALGATAELRDPYTAGHQRRVAELACAIARERDLEEACLESLRIAALLHDIGKIVVPAEILSKPGRLTGPEMQIIRQHADAGANTASLIGFEGDVAEIIRQHHERLDGSGYPKGLRDRSILPEARILAVADVIEAMVSHRPYRPGVPIEVALREIEDGAGTRYDAEVSATAVSLIRGHRFEFSK